MRKIDHSVEFNIGLHSAKLGNVPLSLVFDRCRSRGLYVLQSQVEKVQHGHGTEQTLVGRWLANGHGFFDRVFLLAQDLGQDCIAVRYGDGTGELIGPHAEDWGEFNPAYFVNPGLAFPYQKVAA